LFPVGASRVEARVGKGRRMNPGSLGRGRKVLARVEKKQHQLDTDRTLATKTRMVWDFGSGVIAPFGSWKAI
jgi:hypothetical protein